MTLRIINPAAGQNISEQVFGTMEDCDAFMAFGSRDYGEDTGNPASTFHEVSYWQVSCGVRQHPTKPTKSTTLASRQTTSQDLRPTTHDPSTRHSAPTTHPPPQNSVASKSKGGAAKPMILLRMIDWEEEFDHLTARVIFGRNDLTLTWLIGQPLPPTLVEDVLKTVFGDGFAGAVSSPTGGSVNTPTFAQIEATIPLEVPELPETVAGRDEIITEIKYHLGADIAADADTTTDAEADAAALVEKYESKEGFDPAQSAIVVVGMGGSGKTVLGASIARDPAVAKTFEKILWVTLGKLPDVSKLQGDAQEHAHGHSQPDAPSPPSFPSLPLSYTKA